MALLLLEAPIIVLDISCDGSRKTPATRDLGRRSSLRDYSPRSASTCFHSLSVRHAFFANRVPLVGSILQTSFSSAALAGLFAALASLACAVAAAAVSADASFAWAEAAGEAATVANAIVVIRSSFFMSGLPCLGPESYICSASKRYPPAVGQPM